MKIKTSNLLLLFILSVSPFAHAGEVEILAADFKRTADHTWSVQVTLRHDDSGCDHYADRWRVLDDDGNILGERVLYHPHVTEQPFTRGLSGIVIPDGVTSVYIEAHDSVHGWATKKQYVNLNNL
ncbi:MAG: hypothetical protein KZQ58_10515 [gamma proteobacterium symbiont of Bathyaustriella thionipta]|nr:hypothetical protein [gamma proteobacterium symbiont of Bathyaustriella thionipta]